MRTALALASFLGFSLAQDPTTSSTTVIDTTATIWVTASPSAATAAPQFINNSTFVSAVLNGTNTWRGQFNATPLSWNRTLATFASSYLASFGPVSLENGTECNFSHSGGPYGENIALGCTDVTGCVDLCE